MPESQLPRRCPRCLSRLVAGRDIPAACTADGRTTMKWRPASARCSEVHCQNWPAGASASDTVAQSQQEDEVTDHNKA